MRLLITLFILLFLPASLICQHTAQVKKVVNKVFHITKDKKSNTARPGEDLYSGDEITTDDKSLATVTFVDDKSIIIVRENSNLEIWGDVKERKLSKNTVLNKGKLNFNVTHREEQNFTFTTPTAVASIRGTTGYLESFSDGGTLLYIDSGAVDIQSSVGSKQSGLVQSGMQAKVNSDGGLEIEPAKDEIKLEYKKTSLVNTKKVTIRTDKGEIIIEYTPDGQ